MEPPKRTNRSIMLLCGVLLLGALTRVQLESFDPAVASGATRPFDDLWGGWRRTVIFVLAAALSTTIAVFARRRFSRLTAAGLATAVGGIVSARFDPVSGMVIGFLAGMLVASVRARSLALAVLRSLALAVLAILYGGVFGVLSLATIHDLTKGPGLAACALITLALAFAAALLFSSRVSRWPISAALHRRGCFVRAAWFSFIIVGVWLGLSIDTVRRVWRLDPNQSFQQWRLRPLGSRWLWPGPLGVDSLFLDLRPTDLTYLRAWPELGHLWLPGAEIDDDDLASLEDLRLLWSLELAETPVSDAGLVHLRSLTSLRDLGLRGTRVRGDGLRHLANLRWLQSIGLDGTAVSDDALSQLEGLTAIQSVSLRDTQVIGPGLRSLGKLPALEVLTLDGSRITDDSLEELTGNTRLRYLGLGRTPITDDGLVRLKGLAALFSLDLQETAVSDAGLGIVVGFPKLGFLDVRRTAVTREGVERFKQALPDCYVQWDEVR